MTQVIHKSIRRSPVLGRIGSLETRLARTSEEVRTAQRLRYQIFYEEMGATCDKQTAEAKRDADHFDKYCDHLLVLDKGKIVGTYRLLLEEKAKLAGGFYTQTEFNLEPVLQANKNLRPLELGRSCVLQQYRNKRTMELLWAGTWAYALQNNVGLMFGCASFAGTKPQSFGSSLIWLHENAALDAEEDCRSLLNDRVIISELKAGTGNLKTALSDMPPLLKGYLRVGAKIGSEAVIDYQFGTTDVLVVLKVSDISQRYLSHFGSDASRFAA
ncbi:MAG: GNAT family N-acyltransferase [Rhizobiaceae bacterium]